MKPGFALSLSLEGIALLHRAADGWRVVGDVSLDAPDLTDTLQDLRQRAIELDPRGPICKLIIPNDQIRYLSVAATALDDDENRELALAALATATPYALDDLVFDLRFGATHTQVAAVARATLGEAEQFATEHGFNPLSFVAIPDEKEFDGEPYFGAASHVAVPDSVEQDDEAVSVIGMALEPTPPAETPIETDEPEEPSVPEPAEEEAPEPTPFTSRRSKVDEPSTAPPLAGATRNTAAAQPERPAPWVVDVSNSEVPAAAADPEKVESETAKEDSETPETPPKKTPKPVIIRPVQPANTDAPAPIPTSAKPELKPKDEAERLTVFGARKRAPVGGKPRHLGLILMAALLVFLAGVAAWAALFMEDGLAGLFNASPAETEQVVGTVPQAPDVQSSTPTLQSTAPTTADDEVEIARIDPDTTDSESVTETETATPSTSLSTSEEVPQTPQQDEARYAETGVWQRGPVVPEAPEAVDLDNLYEVSIDRTDLAQDAVALPLLSELDTDQPLDAVTAPAAAGTTFALDAEGLVIPTREGSLTPEGVRVYQGKPPVTPPPTPTRFEVEPDLDAGLDRLAGLRPKLRPTDLVEQNERTQLGGLTREELGEVRPKSRPRTQKQEAERDETPTAQAVVLSKIPKARPRNFGAKVETARKQTAGPSTQVAAAAVAPKPVAPQTVSPRIPSSASVARRATLDNAINLRRVNLIGVYGTPSNRRALIRLPSGRYKKVKVGDRVDGGKIVAIGDSELRYQKSGRNVTLKMPRG